MQKVDSSLQGVECKREQKLADFERVGYLCKMQGFVQVEQEWNESFVL
jgi:hypothetical protein